MEVTKYMVEEISSDKLITAFQNLPEELQNAILDNNVDATIANIGQKNQLHVDKMGTLMVETNLVMFGLTHPEDFTGRLKEKLGLSDDTAKKIASEINAEVFEKIRDTMQKSAEENSGEKMENTSGTSIPISIIQTSEEKILESSGIEVVPETPVFNPSEINPTKTPLGRNETEEELLRGIEDPVPTPTKTIVESKLTDTFTIPKKETEYSLPNLSGDTQKNEASVAIKKDDPYHEPI